MKTKEELNALKNEVEVLNKKLAELSEEELVQVSGGGKEISSIIIGHGKNGKPTIVLWDEASAGLIADPEHPGSGNVSL